jgi:predicted permease
MIKVGSDRKEVVTNFNRASAGYFATMGTPLLAGRDFDERDTPSSPKVAIVDEAFAKQFMNGTNPVGKTFRQLGDQGEPDTEFEIAGLVRNMKYTSLRDDFSPTVFLAASQHKEAFNGQTFVLRSALPLAAVTSEVKRIVADAHPSISLEFSVLRTAIQESLLRERLMALLSGFFGAIAVILATIGLYGVIAYMVTRRQNEIGIRMALGAGAGNVLMLILREAGWLLGIGLTAGVLLTVAFARVAETLVYGIKPSDPLTIAAAAAGLAAVALAASYIPARRASRLDPMVTLRAE